MKISNAGSGNKIEAIKLIRHATGKGLRETADAIDAGTIPFSTILFLDLQAHGFDVALEPGETINPSMLRLILREAVVEIERLARRMSQAEARLGA